MTDVEKAKSLLVAEATCVLVKGEKVYISDKKGIAPMLGFIADGVDLSGFSVADKIVGKAAAMLFVKAGIADVYAETVSRAGLDFLESHGVSVSYNVLTDAIINRDKSGICPMEATVRDIDDVDEAYLALEQKVKSLRNRSEISQD